MRKLYVRYLFPLINCFFIKLYKVRRLTQKYCAIFFFDIFSLSISAIFSYLPLNLADLLPLPFGRPSRFPSAFKRAKASFVR